MIYPSQTKLHSFYGADVVYRIKLLLLLLFLGSEESLNLIELILKSSFKRSTDYTKKLSHQSLKFKERLNYFDNLHEELIK